MAYESMSLEDFPASDFDRSGSECSRALLSNWAHPGAQKESSFVCFDNEGNIHYSYETAKSVLDQDFGSGSGSGSGSDGDGSGCDIAGRSIAFS